MTFIFQLVQLFSLCLLRRGHVKEDVSHSYFQFPVLLLCHQLFLACIEPDEEQKLVVCQRVGDEATTVSKTSGPHTVISQLYLSKAEGEKVQLTKEFKGLILKVGIMH